MRRMFSLLLTLTLTLGLWGCGKDGSSDEKPVQQTMQAGFGRQSITAETSVPLGGGIGEEPIMSQSILDALYVTSIALKGSNGQTVLLISADIAKIPDSVLNRCRQTVAASTQISADAVVLCATNTCSGVDLSASDTEEYQELFVAAVAQSAIDAVADLGEATLKIGSARTENLNFIEPYTVETPNTQADNQVQLLRFVRKGKTDILLANWQCRPDLANQEYTTKRLMSADFVGVVRTQVEKDAKVWFAYFQGAAGNVVARSRDSEIQVPTDVEAFGSRLAEAILAGAKKLENYLPTDLSIRQITATAKRDHSDDKKVDLAQQIVDLWEARQDEAACVKLGKSQSIYSVDHARAILRRSEAGESQQFTMTLVELGNLAFVAVPYEMYNSNALYIKQNSSKDMTWILGSGNGCYGPLPTAQAFDLGSYAVDVRQFDRGTAEEMAKVILKEFNP